MRAQRSPTAVLSDVHKDAKFNLRMKYAWDSLDPDRSEKRLDRRRLSEAGGHEAKELQSPTECTRRLDQNTKRQAMYAACS